jgi:protein-disulfide isomerase
MKYLIIAFAFLAGCVSNDGDVRRAIEKDPDIVFNAIEKNPEKFIDVVNKAAQAAQSKSYDKQMAKMREEQEQDIKNPKKPKLAADRRLSGTANSPITIVEYADFQCPACGMAYRSLKQVKDKYKDQVQFVYKNMPLDFHKMAYPSATYFEAVRMQDRAKAQKFYDLLFEGQRDLSDSFLKKTAKDVGADMARLEKDIKSDAVKTTIAEDMKEFEAFGFTGTPVIIVNGVAMQGAQPAGEIERVIATTKK